MNSKLRNPVVHRYVLAGAVLLLAWLFTFVPLPVLHPVFQLLQSVTYIVLLLIWVYSIHYRITKVRIRRYLVMIGCMMLFWVLVRTMKYYIVADITIKRYLWYLYYVPMLIIPVLSIMTAVIIDKSDADKMPAAAFVPWIPSLLLSVMVLTNDRHQLVFAFDYPQPWSDAFGYRYCFLYYVTAAWIILCMFAVFFLLIRKFRRPDSGLLYIPLVPGILLLLYNYLYITDSLIVKYLFDDMTAFCCFLLVMFFELSMHVGLIPSNTHYRDLFAVSMIPMEILDPEDGSYIVSDNMTPVSEEQYQFLLSQPMIEDGQRISVHDVNEKKVILKEDVSSLVRELEELEDASQFLQARNAAVQDAYQTRLKKRELKEKTRLYDLVQKSSEADIKELSDLINQLYLTRNRDKEDVLLKRVLLTGTYMKRRNNLLLSAQEDHILPLSELSFSIHEILQNLSIFHIVCGCSLPEGDVNGVQVIAAFDEFYRLLKDNGDSLESVFVSGGTGETGFSLTVRMTGQEYLDTHLPYEKEDDREWVVMIGENA